MNDSAHDNLSDFETENISETEAAKQLKEQEALISQLLEQIDELNRIRDTPTGGPPTNEPVNPEGADLDANSANSLTSQSNAMENDFGNGSDDVGTSRWVSEIRSKLGFEPACTAGVLQEISPKCLSALSNLFVFESEASDSDIASLFAQINPIALTVLDAALYDKLGLKPAYFAQMTRTQMYQLPVIKDLGKLSSSKLKEEQSKHICHKVNAENVDFTHLPYTDTDKKARYPSSFKEWCRRSDSTKIYGFSLGLSLFVIWITSTF